MLSNISKTFEAIINSINHQQSIKLQSILSLSLGYLVITHNFIKTVVTRQNARIHFPKLPFPPIFPPYPHLFGRSTSQYRTFTT